MGSRQAGWSAGGGPLLTPVDSERSAFVQNKTRDICALSIVEGIVGERGAAAEGVGGEQ